MLKFEQNTCVFPCLGQCECRKNIMGRRCDECSFGFYGFPTCRQCTCNIAGTEPRICDPYNARCICKVKCLKIYIYLMFTIRKISIYITLN